MEKSISGILNHYLNMACGGFTCTKNALISLNVLYMLVAMILIAVASWSKATAVITWINLIGAVLACGVFLLLVALLGLIGAAKHHQVSLFFYMLILFVVFVLQFAMACAILGVSKQQQMRLVTEGWKHSGCGAKSEFMHLMNCCGRLVKEGWKHSGSEAKSEFMHLMDCCGFDVQSQDLGPQDPMGHPWCQNKTSTCRVSDAICCTGLNTNSTDICACPADPCQPLIEERMDDSARLVGGVGLFFSFTELAGVFMAFRYRNMKDPRANPNAFL